MSFLTDVNDKYLIHAASIIAYHGTNTKFTKFDKSKRELGFHFGSTKEQALDRGKYLIKAKLILTNPYDIVSDLGQWDDMEMLKEYLGEANEGPFTNEEFDKFKNSDDVRSGLKKLGYDGLVYDNSFEGQKNAPSYIVFEPEQIHIIEWL